MSPQSLPTKDQRQPPPRLENGLYFVSPPHVRVSFVPCKFTISVGSSLRGRATYWCTSILSDCIVSCLWSGTRHHCPSLSFCSKKRERCFVCVSLMSVAAPSSSLSQPTAGLLSLPRSSPRLGPPRSSTSVGRQNMMIPVDAPPFVHPL